jgi:hypothetical protein
MFLVLRLISPEETTLKMGKYSAKGEVKYLMIALLPSIDRWAVNP